MDNERLNEILVKANSRQFWIVLWGYPELSADEGKQIFDDPVYEEGLTRYVQDMRKGDILFVHRIHISKIIYISEVTDLPRKSTEEESEVEEWKKRWTWAIRARNLTPEYGQHWRRCGEKTFNLARQFNELYPDEPVNIRRLNYGSHVKIPYRFAAFLLNEIMSLEVDKCMREDSFRSWLLRQRGPGTVASRLSNCRVVEKWEGDLAQQYEQDGLRGLLERLTYTKDDERYGREASHKIPIDGTATYKAAVSLYKQFLDDTSVAENKPRIVSPSHLNNGAATSKIHRVTLAKAKPRPLEAEESATISASQLADWRRKLIKCLVELETPQAANEVVGIAERISRLQRSGLIPRETAALMRTITEMRNAAEYQDKTPVSSGESCGMRCMGGASRMVG
jgi:hypothetical protein